MFNPARNTDTYRPGIRNIDTYRANPNQNPVGNGYNYGYNVNNIPVNNIDNELEEVKNDLTNTTEKIVNVEEKTSVSKNVDKNELTQNLQTKFNKLPDSVSKTQEVRNYKNLSQHQTGLQIDHSQTNKKIEKLIKG